MRRSGGAHMSQMRSLYSPSPWPPSTSASRHMISSCSTWLKLPFIFLVAGSICINSHTIISKKIGIVAFLSSMKIKGKMLNVREMFVLPQSTATSLINITWRFIVSENQLLFMWEKFSRDSQEHTMQILLGNQSLRLGFCIDSDKARGRNWFIPN